MRGRWSSWRVLAHRGDQPLAGAREPRHHGADRHAGDVARSRGSRGPARRAAPASPGTELAAPRSRARGAPLSVLAISAASGVSRRCRYRACRMAACARSTASRSSTIEQRGRAVLAQPAIGGVAHDGQRPGAGVDAGKAADAAQRAQAGFLHHVLGVGAVARQPAGERVAIGEIRQHHLPEAGPILARWRTLPWSLCVVAACDILIKIE